MQCPYPSHGGARNANAKRSATFKFSNFLVNFERSELREQANLLWKMIDK